MAQKTEFVTKPHGKCGTVHYSCISKNSINGKGFTLLEYKIQLLILAYLNLCVHCLNGMTLTWSYSVMKPIKRLTSHSFAGIETRVNLGRVMQLGYTKGTKVLMRQSIGSKLDKYLTYHVILEDLLALVPQKGFRCGVNCGDA
jgi:hypothetical protein